MNIISPTKIKRPALSSVPVITLEKSPDINAPTKQIGLHRSNSRNMQDSVFPLQDGQISAINEQQKSKTWSLRAKMNDQLMSDTKRALPKQKNAETSTVTQQRPRSAYGRRLDEMEEIRELLHMQCNELQFIKEQNIEFRVINQKLILQNEELQREILKLSAKKDDEFNLRQRILENIDHNVVLDCVAEILQRSAPDSTNKIASYDTKSVEPEKLDDSQMLSARKRMADITLEEARSIIASRQNINTDMKDTQKDQK